MPVSDFVDPSIADWIESETKLMDSVWGPPDRTRGALAFVHIPPYVFHSLPRNALWLIFTIVMPFKLSGRP